MATPRVSFSTVLQAIHTNLVTVTQLPADCILFSAKRGPNPKAQLDVQSRLIFIRPQEFTPVQPRDEGGGRFDFALDRRIDINIAVWLQLDPADEDKIKLMSTYGYFDLEQRVLDALENRTIIDPDVDVNAIGLNLRCVGGSAPLVGEPSQKGWMDGTVTFRLEYFPLITTDVL